MLTLKQAAAWCCGKVLPEYEAVAFQGAENDSRKIQPGQLFVALKAARDGHDFIGKAMEAGEITVPAEKTDFLNFFMHPERAGTLPENQPVDEAAVWPELADRWMRKHTGP